MTARNITQQPECHTFNGAAPPWQAAQHARPGKTA